MNRNSVLAALLGCGVLAISTAVADVRSDSMEYLVSSVQTGNPSLDTSYECAEGNPPILGLGYHTKSWPTNGYYECPNSGPQGNLSAWPNPVAVAGWLGCPWMVPVCTPIFGTPSQGTDSEGPFIQVTATERSLDGTSCVSGSVSTAKAHTYNVFNTSETCRPDSDGDGWSPYDDNADCDDNDFETNPGVVPTCDVGSGEDRNCDGIEDLSQCNSPVVIDVAGNGFSLTNAQDGVLFDLDGDGVPLQLSWTASGSDDAWLAFDRNGNGQIDDGTELFGNWAPQPGGGEPNGFKALAELDKTANGGNANGWFDGGDTAFGAVRLWTDTDHNGRARASELRTLRQGGIVRIGLDPKETRHRDQWGNWFRYRSRVFDTRNRDVGKFAWDVYLVAIPNVPAGQQPDPSRAPFARPKTGK